MGGISITRGAKSRSVGYKSAPAGDSFDIVDNAPDPKEQVEALLDMPQGETVGASGEEALRRFFEVVSMDIKPHGKRANVSLIRRILAIGHRVGALKEFTLEELADYTECRRQAICQSAGVVEDKIGRQFHRENPGPKGARGANK